MTGVQTCALPIFLDVGNGVPLGLVEVCWDGWLMGWIGDLNWDISRGCLHGVLGLDLSKVNLLIGDLNWDISRGWRYS